MSSTITLQALGLNLSPNQLDQNSTPPGSLLIANDVIIRRENVIEPRRGYKLYGTSFGGENDRLKQLMTYKGRLLRHFDTTIQFDTLVENIAGQSIFESFCGNYSEPEPGRRIRFLEANSNFYFTTSQGIKKISALNASQFTSACTITTGAGQIVPAGGVKALDVTTRLKIELGNQSGWFPQDSVVAYRVVWGYTDANSNLILGTPSQRSVIYNPLINLLLLDFKNLLEELDNVSNYAAAPSLINDGDYFDDLGSANSASELYTNLIALASKLDNDIIYADDGVPSSAPLVISTASSSIVSNICTITFSSGNPQDYFVSGSNIYLDGFTTSLSGSINGPQVVATVTVTPNTITFPTSATGTISSSDPTIVSYEYRNLIEPDAPSIPATDDQLVDLQNYLQGIITRLQSEPSTGTPPVISSASQTTFITPIELTTTATVILNITIPESVTTNYFYQIYRSGIAQATGTEVLATDVFPNDELRLVYEAYPTATDISNGYIIIEDVTPPEFAGAFLYTNSTTGDGSGILGANNPPPFALDIAYFKNCTFYANTKTLYSQSLNLLGVAQMINSSSASKITFTDGTTTNTYTFVTGLQETTNITTVADVAGSLAGKYFTIWNVNDLNEYTFYYKVNGVGSAPVIADAIIVPVYINTGDTAAVVAQKTVNAMSVHYQDFSVSAPTVATFTVTNVEYGASTDASAGTSGFAITVTQQGRGQDTTLKQVLLSTNPSPAQAVDETARSLISVINSNASEIVYGYYFSDVTNLPGEMFFEARDISVGPFYILANNSIVGSSFNPDISPDFTITSISVANPTVITTSAPHGLINQDQVVISGSNSTPIVDGLHTITYISPTTFSIPVNVTIAGNTGGLSKSTETLTATNLRKVNRVYYSKILQPEAVPIINFIDVGAQDAAILRIFPLRDTLFVFKEDGLFRISGEVAPFNLALFDKTTNLLAPDSLDTVNNLLYGWTNQGLQSISESDVKTISRPIDTEILKLQTAQYLNFRTATWGIGYNSDNSYQVATIIEQDDIYAQIIYRYSTLTHTWTIYTKTTTCGIINPVNDREYFGAGDVNFMEEERKNYNREDYADREYVQQLIANHYFGIQLQLSDIDNLLPGDVITQDQTMTVFGYNNILQKLDTDVTLEHDYQSELEMEAGETPRIKLDELLNKIANDPVRLAQPGALNATAYTVYEEILTVSTITGNTAADPTIVTTASAHNITTGRQITITGSNSSPSIDGIYDVIVLSPTTFSIPVDVIVPGTTGTVVVNNNSFDDIEASYNGMVNTLNSDPGVAYGNYLLIDHTTLQEAIILSINKANKKVTLNLTLDFMVGPITIYKAIPSLIQYSPQTFGSALTLKHISEAELLFENKAFSYATLSFSSDLLPAFNDIPFQGTSNGIFGFNNFGFNFFGGASHAAPFRTYVPRPNQRCRFLNCRFSHTVARETFSLFALTLSGVDTGSTRGYR